MSLFILNLTTYFLSDIWLSATCDLLQFRVIQNDEIPSRVKLFFHEHTKRRVTIPPLPTKNPFQQTKKTTPISYKYYPINIILTTFLTYLYTAEAIKLALRSAYVERVIHRGHGNNTENAYKVIILTPIEIWYCQMKIRWIGDLEVK